MVNVAFQSLSLGLEIDASSRGCTADRELNLRAVNQQSSTKTHGSCHGFSMAFCFFAAGNSISGSDFSKWWNPDESKSSDWEVLV
jgi:hypothetical protein